MKTDARFISGMAAVPRSVPSLQYYHGSWAEQTFPHQTNASILEHLKREVKELEDAAPDKVPEEAADCLLLLLSFAHRNGFDLTGAAIQKFLVNQTRQWGQPDEHGVVEHIDPS